MNKKNITIMTIGLGLFGVVAAKMGWRGMIEELKAVWIALPVLVALSAARLLLQTMSWKCALQTDGIHTGIGQLMGARVSSKGMGYLSVLGPIVAEPMRISLLGKDAEAATSATLIDTGVYWFSSGLFAILGSLCAVVYMGGHNHTGALIWLAVSTLIGLVMIARGQALLPGLVKKLGSKAPSWLKKAEEKELALRSFKNAHPKQVRRMFWMGIACQVLMVMEIAAIFWALKMPIHCGMILALEAANRVVKAMGSWVPARIGADETGMAAAFLAFGLPSASGLALALARRSRDLLEVVIGFTWLALRSRTVKVQPINRASRFVVNPRFSPIHSTGSF
jgi:uncharacterized membrane protein YbhN (UPF0104 family)